MNLGNNLDRVALRRYSTHFVEPCSRVDYWNKLSNTLFSRVVVDPHFVNQFSASATSTHIDELGLTEVSCAPATIHHTEAHTRYCRSCRYYLLHLQLDGRCVNTQVGRTSTLQSGDFFICDTTKPYTVVIENSARFIVVRFPAAALGADRRLLGNLAGLHVSGGSGSAQLMSIYLQKFFSEAISSPAQSWLQEAGGIALDLLAVACRAATTTFQQDGMNNGLDVFDHLRQHIGENFLDPDFEISKLADKFSLSPRTVQRSFARQGTTPGTYLQELRLRHAAQLLVSSHSGNITQVAIESGFSDASYFSRAFRKKFGLSPRAYRLQQIANH